MNKLTGIVRMSRMVMKRAPVVAKTTFGFSAGAVKPINIRAGAANPITTQKMPKMIRKVPTGGTLTRQKLVTPINAPQYPTTKAKIPKISITILLLIAFTILAQVNNKREYI